MKLIYCDRCKDIFAIRNEPMCCSCGECSGHYKDRVNAVVTESSIMIGFDWRHFQYALNNRPIKGLGKQFKAFVIPYECNSVEVVAKDFYENKYAHLMHEECEE